MTAPGPYPSSIPWTKAPPEAALPSKWSMPIPSAQAYPSLQTEPQASRMSSAQEAFVRAAFVRVEFATRRPKQHTSPPAIPTATPQRDVTEFYARALRSLGLFLLGFFLGRRTVFEHFVELFFEEFFFTNPFDAQTAHTRHLLLTHFPRLFGDADIRTQYDIV